MTDDNKNGVVQRALHNNNVLSAFYGQPGSAAKAENGSFTQHGYLTESKDFIEAYRRPEDIPGEYRESADSSPKQYDSAKTSDLAGFVYKLHALAGEYMSEAHSNVSTLANGSEHFLMLIDGQKINICAIDSPYHRDTADNDIWLRMAVTPFDVVRGCVRFAAGQAFGIKADNIDGFLKWAERNSTEIIRRAVSLGEREDSKTRGQEL